MTEIELADVLLTILTGATGRSRAYWQKVLGPMQRHPLTTHPRCNWQFSPSGAPEDMTAAEKAIDVVRAAHPYVQ